MKLFIIILLTNCVYLLCDKLGYKMSKTQLRGMYKKELERIMQLWFTESFNNVFNNIIESAKQGKKDFQFKVVCSERNYFDCKMDGITHHVMLPQISPSNVNINIKNYVTKLIDKLHEIV